MAERATFCPSSGDIGVRGGEATRNEACVERRGGDKGEGRGSENEESEEDEKGAGHFFARWVFG